MTKAISSSSLLVFGPQWTTCTSSAVPESVCASLSLIKREIGYFRDVEGVALLTSVEKQLVPAKFT